MESSRDDLKQESFSDNEGKGTGRFMPGITDEQGAILDVMEQFNYNNAANQAGICISVARVGLAEFFKGTLENFNKDNEYLVANRRDNELIVEKINNKVSDENGINFISIKKRLDKIDKYQNPEDYRSDFNGETLTQQDAEVLFEHNEGFVIKLISSFCDMYPQDKEGLAFYVDSITKTLEKTQVRTGMVLENFDHAICLCYSYRPEKNQYYIIDASNPKKIINEILSKDDLLKYLYEQFMEEKISGFNTSVFFSFEGSDYSNADLDKLEKAFKAIREKTLEESHLKNTMDLKDPNDVNLGYLAAEYGHDDIIHKLAELDPASLTQPCITGDYPTHAAVKNGHNRVVMELIKAQININKPRTMDELTPLFIAAKYGRTDMIQFFNTPEILNYTLENKNTVLHYTAGNSQNEFFKDLIKAGAKITTSIDGISPAHVAASLGNIDLLKFLFSLDKEIFKVRDSDGNSLAIFAVVAGSLETLKYLESIDAVDDKPSVLLKHAKDQEIIKYLEQKMGSGLDMYSAFAKRKTNKSDEESEKKFKLRN